MGTRHRAGFSRHSEQSLSLLAPLGKLGSLAESLEEPKAPSDPGSQNLPSRALSVPGCFGEIRHQHLLHGASWSQTQSCWGSGPHPRGTDRAAWFSVSRVREARPGVCPRAQLCSQCVPPAPPPSRSLWNKPSSAQTPGLRLGLGLHTWHLGGHGAATGGEIAVSVATVRSRGLL